MAQLFSLGSMTPCHYYEPPLQIASEAVRFMFMFWPITLALFIAFLIALVVKSPFGLSGLKCSRQHLCILIPIAMTVLMTMVGSAVLDSYQHSPSPTPGWISGIVLLLVLVQLAICFWIVWLMKGYRLFAAFAVALQYLFTLGCGFILLTLLDNAP